MYKIFLILKREYLVRVQKKSFIPMTLLGPLLMGGLITGSILLAKNSVEDKTVDVVDESGLFKDKFKDSQNVKFRYSTLDLASAKKNLPKGDAQALLYIPTLDVKQPKGIVLFAEKNVSLEMLNTIEQVLSKEIEGIKLLQAGINRDVLKSTETSVSIKTVSLSAEGEKDSSSNAAFILGYIGAFLIYMSVFIYGAQVMRGVLEEKTNRIVEVIISSVKPFQLMMGKITGVALVGLTQFFLWIILSWGVIAVTSSYFGAEEVMKARTGQSMVLTGNQAPAANDNKIAQLGKALETQNIPLLIGTFLFYFLGGYLLYSALFAAIGAAADSETDTQQFMFPITIPLIASIIMAQFVLQDPDSSLAFWVSMIPLTSPVLMMIRIPFGVPTGELLLSMVLLVVGFVATTWLAARVYRVGILMYGKKVNFKELSKWIFYKA